MDLTRALTILESKTWFFSSYNVSERLDALRVIGTSAEWRLIDRLIPILRDRQAAVRDAAADSISSLLRHVSSKTLFESLKYAPFTVAEIGGYRKVFSDDRSIDLLILASFNHDGFVRERAVLELGRTDNPKAILPLTYRLGDWVEQVRDASATAISAFKTAKHLGAFLESIADLERMIKVERVNLGPIYKSLIHYLILENREQVRTDFRSHTEKTRQAIAKHISRSWDISEVDLDLLLSDRNPYVRSIALDHFNKLSPVQQRNLLKDRYYGVRLKALRNLTEQKDFLDLLIPSLVDVSSSIRQFARYHLRERISHFSDVYVENIERGVQLDVSLTGLGEVGTNGHAWVVEAYIDHSNTKVRKSALKSFIHLDPIGARDKVLSYLDDPDHGLRKMARSFFERRASLEVIQRFREIFAVGDIVRKLEVLNFYGRVGRWNVLGDIIFATLDENISVRQLAVDHLRRWIGQSSNLFVRPDEDSLNHLRQLAESVRREHEKKLYFETNPLDGFSFYLE